MSLKDKLAAAEAALKQLETPRHNFENTRVDLVKAMQDGAEAKVVAAMAAHEKAIAERQAANVSEDDIHKAAQAVLDVRDEIEAEAAAAKGKK